jgi:hypothetical protein
MSNKEFLQEMTNAILILILIICVILFVVYLNNK